MALSGKGLPHAPTYGVPEGSTLERLADLLRGLEPYYEKAEYEIGVSGDDPADPFHAPRRKPLPMPPLPPNREYGILKPAAKRLGLHPFDIPCSATRVPYNGQRRLACVPLVRGLRLRGERQMRHAEYRDPRGARDGNCELRTGCMAQEILTDARARHGRGILRCRRPLREQTADHRDRVVGGAIESARLLLNSKSGCTRAGLGNRYDWVGRNLQGHTYSGGVGPLRFRYVTTISGPARASRSATTTTATPA